MYRASLSPQEHGLNRVGGWVQIQLEDQAIQAILDGLQTAVATLTVDLVGKERSGDERQVRMCWNQKLAAFECRIEGKPAGLIPYDELAGALDQPLSNEAMPCIICLPGLIDIWRRGCVDTKKGLVYVYTNIPDLSFAGNAKGFIQDGVSKTADAFEFRLACGEPANGPLVVPESQRCQFRFFSIGIEVNKGSGFSPEEGISAMTSLLEQFEKTFTGKAVV